MKTLKRGSRGEEVKVLQRALHLIEDGIFGALTEEAVKAHQRRYGLTEDGIVGVATWATINTAAALKLKTKRTIKEIIVHCTASVEGVPTTVEAIRAYHTAKPAKDRGWSDIAYHFVVYLDGSVHAGRPIDRIGGHTIGHNTYSIGIVYVGGLDKAGKPKDTRTEAQKRALRDLLVELKAIYPKATIHGHNEFANKACPCFDVRKEYAGL